MISVRIERLEQFHYPWRWAVSFDYDPELVDEIKLYIPKEDRRWEMSTKSWWFTSRAMDGALILIDNRCSERENEQESKRKHDPGQKLTEKMLAAYLLLHVTPSAPDSVVRAAYRTLAKIHHPDAGGTTEDMQRLNAAFLHLMPEG